MRLALLLAMVFVMALVFMLHLNTTIREEVDGVRSSPVVNHLYKAIHFVDRTFETLRRN